MGASESSRGCGGAISTHFGCFLGEIWTHLTSDVRQVAAALLWPALGYVRLTDQFGEEGADVMLWIGASPAICAVCH